MIDQRQWCTMYIVHHGESEANVQEVFGGNTPLTPMGREQARRFAEHLTVTLHAVFSSHLDRARQTAAIIASSQRLVVKPLRGLHERHYGSLEGRPHNEVRALLETSRQTIAALSEQEKLAFKMVEDMESSAEAGTRFLGHLKRLAKKHKGRNILVASHGNIMRVLLMLLGFATYDQLQPNSIVNTGYIKLQTDGKTFTVEEVQGITVQKG